MNDEEKQRAIDLLLPFIMKGVSDVDLMEIHGESFVKYVLSSKEYKLKKAEAEIEAAEKRHNYNQARIENKALAVKRQREILEHCDVKDANLSNQINNLTSKEIELDKNTGKLDAQEGREVQAETAIHMTFNPFEKR